MSAVAGIRGELAARRAERDEFAPVLALSHAAYDKARVRFERDQMRVETLNDRIEDLVKALHILGERDTE